MSDETPNFSLRDLVGPLFDEAINQVAPNEEMMWDISWQLAPDQRTGQLGVGCLLLLIGPSPLIGTGSLTSWMIVELNKIRTLDEALVPIRHLVERNRAARAKMLKLN